MCVFAVSFDLSFPFLDYHVERRIFVSMRFRKAFVP